MKTLGKSLSMLELFLNENNELSLDELAKLSGINKSTTRRILKSLIEHGFLTQTRNRGKYSLGMKFLEFSQAIRRDFPIVDIARPFLVQLGQQIDETIALAIWNGKKAFICQWLYPNHPLKVNVYDGEMSGLHQTSLGKAILAELPEMTLDTVLGKDLEQFTPNTISDIEEFKRHLINVRRNGVAFDDEEGYIGVRGIAAAFKNTDGKVAGAVTVLGPTVRLSRHKDKENIPAIKACALSISQALGYKG